MDYGVVMFPTEYAIAPDELAGADRILFSEPGTMGWRMLGAADTRRRSLWTTAS